MGDNNDFPGRLLHQACVWENAELLEDLLKNGEEVGHIDSEDKYGRTPLHAAAKSSNPSLVGALLNNGANPNIQSSLRAGAETPLHIAAHHGRLEAVAGLLSSDAATDVRNSRNQTPLDVAIERKQRDCVEMLKIYQEAKAEKLEICRKEFIDAFVCGDFMRIENVLLSLRSDAARLINDTSVNGVPVLTRAVAQNDAELVRLFIRNAAAVTITLKEGSPLYEAAFRGNQEMVQLFLEVCPTLVSKSNELGWLPLHVAINMQHRDIVDLLLNFVYPDELLQPYLDITMTWTYRMAFDINALTADNQTPLFLAVETSNIRLVEQLLARKVKAINEKGEVKDLSPLQLDLPSYNGETALFAAVKSKNQAIVRLLLEWGADPNQIVSLGNDGTQSNSLAAAVRNSDLTILKILLEKKATDEGHHALSAVTSLGSAITPEVLSRILTLHSHRDTEFRINKKLMELASAKGIKTHSAAAGSLSYSAIFPTVPVAINWQKTAGLKAFDETWLLQSAAILNPKVAGGMAFFAITKLDISGGDLEEIPACVFRLQSLRTLNASSNRISRFQPLDLCRNSFACQCPVLQDVNLSHNCLTAAPDDLFYFPSLVTLDLSYNSIHNLPFAMWQAPVLKDLNLMHNQIESLPLRSDKAQVFERSLSQIDSKTALDSSFGAENDVCVKSSEVMQQPVHRKNLWASRLMVENLKSTETRMDKNESALKTINLAFNALVSAPLGLACLAPNLAKLVLSHNGLQSIGIIQDYPAGLKHLDVSFNKLEISLKPGTADEMDDICFYEESSWHKGKRIASPTTEEVCAHRKHWRLDNLRTLTAADNRLRTFEVTGAPPARKGSRTSSGSSGLLDGFSNSGSSLLYPNLSVLDISANNISEIPETMANMTNLSVLNIEGNTDVTDIPPHLGLLPKLWTFNAHGCNLGDPLKGMFDNKQYKTVDILGYLKSSLERCQPYTRMKLMLVGLENKGKTSLLKALKSEETHKKNKHHESNWTQRMGPNGPSKTHRSASTQLSTVGIDLGEWTFSDGNHEVTFRTWDFAGQREYYATHQYFLSRRSIYLVVWNMMDGFVGIKETTQWLVNIQARAPGSPVIIVGTHIDELKHSRFPPGHVESLKREVRERFMGVMDADKHGLPRVVGCIEVSCKTKQHVPQLCRMIAEAAWELRTPGTNKRLMEQQVPAIYIALEDLLSALAYEYRESGQHPVVTTEYFRAIVAHELYERFNMTFRDSAELRQAVMFLHDNGILLHYEDCSALKDLYFLDPQWLCDTLASVITVREINPFVKKGIMKVDDLKVLFKPSKYALIDIHTYILNLLNKFEVALKLDTRTLLIPCLLPMKTASVDFAHAESIPLKIEIKSTGRNWIHFKPYLESPEEAPVKIENLVPDRKLRILRYYLMLYFPSGFWPRLTSRLVSDDRFFKDLRGYYSEENKPGLAVEWLCWQNALELRFGDNVVLKLKEMSTNTKLSNSVLLNHETGWRELSLENKAVMEIQLPMYKKGDILVSNVNSVSMILNRCVNHIDSLLEDWYPSLGTKFIHTSTGQYLVTKLIPCPDCMEAWRTRDKAELENSGNDDESMKRRHIRAFSVEQAIYRAVTGYADVLCLDHGNIKLSDIAPETKFLDLPADKVFVPGDLKRGRILGRGAFGFVYRATVKPKLSHISQEVAVKMLLPVDPGFGAEPAAISAYKSVIQQWEHDPLQSYCKAYWTARQELSILTVLSHHHIVGLVGLCLQPLGIVLQLAPKGSLLDHLKAMRQSNEKVSTGVVQQICVQITKALEYLHGFRIIYRDLKSDNVLVWSLDKKVLVKLTDYGISRAVTAASTTKGFAGTEAYIAPEIIQYGGEEEYNEGVDMFSFGMLMYELLTLRQPFDGQDQVKDIVLDGGRPAVMSWTLNYPSLMLDLLVISWSQLAKDRPTSSQALSICNTPEFGHLQDVAMLEDVGLHFPKGGVFAVPDGFGIALADGTLNVVSCTAHKWTESKLTSTNKDAAVSHCLLVQDFIWLFRGTEVSLYCVKTLDFFESFPVTFGGALQQAEIDCCIYVPDRQRVVVSLSTQRLLVLNTHAALRKNKLVEAFCGLSLRCHQLLSVSKNELWAACDKGKVLVINIRDDGVAEDCIIEHAVDAQKKVADIAASAKEGIAWSYLEEDTMLYAWSLLKPHILHKLDCERLIPVSESLNSIGIDEASQNERKRHICCLCYCDGLLYVGTIWGSLVVVQSQTLNPLSVIRPHVDRMQCILPLRFPDGPRIITVGQGYRDVISRFFNHDNVKQSISPMTLCAAIWRTSDWALA